MYPRVSDLFRDLLGVELPFPIYSFGLLVAVAILTGTWLAAREMDRLYRAGQLGGVQVPVDDERGRQRGKTREASPSVLMPTVAILAAVAGVAGSKLFHLLENPVETALDPWGMLFSGAGLTFYGGLICAGLGIAWYVRRRGLHVGRVADATAPSLLWGYGIGRIGCYLAGDGDWGVCSDLSDKPAWLPDWLWSETFPNSILDRGNRMTQDALRIEDCPAWADGVYPTMLYETAMALALFGVLWALRTHPFRAGWLFMLYLVFNGVERFLIEQIRVNNTFDVLGLTVTQAEVIAVAITLAGVAGLAWRTRRVEQPDAEKEAAA